MDTPLYNAFSTIKFKYQYMNGTTCLPFLKELVDNKAAMAQLAKMYEPSGVWHEIVTQLNVSNTAINTLKVLGLSDSLYEQFKYEESGGNLMRAQTNFWLEVVNQLREVQKRQNFDQSSWSIPSPLLKTDTDWPSFLDLSATSRSRYASYIRQERDIERLERSRANSKNFAKLMVTGLVASFIITMGLTELLQPVDVPVSTLKRVVVMAAYTVLAGIPAGAGIYEYVRLSNELKAIKKNLIRESSLNIPLERWKHHEALSSWDRFEAYERGELRVRDDVIKIICEQLRIAVTLGILNGYTQSSLVLRDDYTNTDHYASLWKQFNYKAYTPYETYLALLDPTKVCEASLYQGALHSFGPTAISTPSINPAGDLNKADELKVKGYSV